MLMLSLWSCIPLPMIKGMQMQPSHAGCMIWYLQPIFVANADEK